VGERVGVPLGHDDHGLFGFAGLLLRRGRVPAGVDLVVLRVGRTDGRGEAQEGFGGEFAGAGAVLPVGILRESFGAHVGGKELWMALFEVEVSGCGVGEEVVGALDDELVRSNHAFEIVGIGGGGVEAREPIEAPLERADDAVGIASCKGSLPGDHPFCVELGEHEVQFTKGRMGRPDKAK